MSSASIRRPSVQTTDQVLMIRPARFLSNPETAVSNAFQHAAADAGTAQRAALAEFDAYVSALRAAGVGVLVVEDSIEPHTPDSIFPNNWVSFHADGRVLLYPMQAPNRRQERRPAVLAAVAQQFEIREQVDLSSFEVQDAFLEGTGSLVLDHEHRIAYACHSPRTHPRAMAAFCARTGYRAHWFHAVDSQGVPIYHTNVMMCVGRTLALVCLEALPDAAERSVLAQALAASGKQVIEISRAQMHAFAGNMLELRAADGRPVFALSQRAWASLSEDQQSRIAGYARTVLAPIDTIEHLGGGGARCMIAEIFLPRRIAGACMASDQRRQAAPACDPAPC